MPAYLRNSDFAALKWVSGYPENPARGRPYISGVLIVTDADTGFPVAIMDATEITAARTAAASGVCIRQWGPRDWSTAAVLGCGEQGRFHASVLHALKPSAEIVAYDVDASRAEALIEGAVVAQSAREAVDGADIVITAGPIVESADPPMRVNWLDERWLLLPIDFDFYVSAEVVRAADALIVDDVGQFLSYQQLGYFKNWPEPLVSVGTALENGLGGDRVLACNLGVGALDAAFAKAVLDRLGR
jgi:ornithine cyclodeaminase/alanine dehydrogenase